MKFQIPQRPEERFRPSTVIPLQYCSFLSNIAKPVVMRSAQVDILYQNRSIKGCTLRDMIFYVREAVTLLVRVNNPVTSIHCMLKGEIVVQMNGVGKVLLKQGEYDILQMNTDEHALILPPGVHELQRYDYRERIISKDGKPEWLDKLTSNESAILEHGELGERLIKRQEELRTTRITNEEQDEWFYAKMRKFLLNVLDQQQIIKE